MKRIMYFSFILPFIIGCNKTTVKKTADISIIHFYKQSNASATPSGLQVLIESQGSKTYICGYYKADKTPDFNRIESIVCTAPGNDTTCVYAYENGQLKYCYNELISTKANLEGLIKVTKSSNQLEVNFYEATWDTLPPLLLLSYDVTKHNGEFVVSETYSSQKITAPDDVFPDDLAAIIKSVDDKIKNAPGVLADKIKNKTKPLVDKWNSIVDKVKSIQNGTTTPVNDQYGDPGTESNPVESDQSAKVSKVNDLTYISLNGVNIEFTGINNCQWNGPAVLGSIWRFRLIFGTLTTEDIDGAVRIHFNNYDRWSTGATGGEYKILAFKDEINNFISFGCSRFEGYSELIGEVFIDYISLKEQKFIKSNKIRFTVYRPPGAQ